MKKYNKIFKNRQILTSEEMNDIVDVINDIISQFNMSNSDDRYFRIRSSTDTINVNQTSQVTIRIEALDGAGDIRNIKIYWDKDGFDQALNSYAETSITVPISETTTFKASLAVADTNNLITKSLTIRAISPTYFGSGKTQESVVGPNGPVSERTQSRPFYDRVSGIFNINIYKNEHIFFFVPASVEFDLDEIYLDSILFPIEQSAVTAINGINYIVYKSSGGDLDRGFDADGEVTLEAL